MEQLNRIEIRGHVGAIRKSRVSDKTVANLTVATSYAYKGKDNCPIIETTWHNVTAWEGKDITCLDSIQKGSKVYITGRIRNQRYTDADGVERASTEIIANQIIPVADDELLHCQM